MIVSISEEALKEKTKNVFIKEGLTTQTAKDIADVLVHANLRGVDSHGVMRVEHYVKRIREGGIHPLAVPTVEQTSPTTWIMDGDHGFGHSISKQAMQQAIKAALSSGIAAIAVKNSSHCGALSYFVEQAASENMIGVAMSHTDKVVVPFGGSAPFFGTNPIAFGFPTKEEQNVILDFATSTVALGKILNAKEHGQTIPEGWGVKADGSHTVHPEEVSYLTPFGGPKGYGLAMVVEIFSALLTGAAFGPHVSKMYGDYNQHRELGHFFMVIDPSVFTGLESFTTRLDQMIHELHQAAPAKGVEQVLVPGELEAQTAKKRQKDGIPIPKHILDFLDGN